ncbi:glycosyltransferase family 2 protein [Olivibacter sp. SDN3]|nr:glycosyltransferase family 2 protein [Olivibacter sp. SDN3]
MKAALLISTYNWPGALTKVLSSVRCQQILPSEVLIADDGSDEKTAKLVRAFQKEFPVPLRHFWHPDGGFRKTIIMNQAIAATSCDYIIQIDGDITLHERFIEDHLSIAEDGYYIKGSRVLLSEKKSKAFLAAEHLTPIKPYSIGITNRINALRSLFLADFFTKRRKRSHDLRGCNCAFWKKDFVAVNGYNNDLVGWGHEDIELAARFINLGLLQKSVKLQAVCYHLHHTFNERNNERGNYGKYKEVVDSGVVRCQNGLNNDAL